MKNGSDQQSMLARLLSKENISVQHGKYSTAFFDVKNRVLGLPIWKDRGKDVYDLLVGHEVGHALYTPSNGLDHPLPCNKDYLNIVEDVRIERMIQATYPGLVGVFRRAYSSLNADNFFGTADKDIAALPVGDRVNLKAKLGSLVNITFTEVEKPIVDQVMAVQTWEDVVAAAIALQNLAQAQNSSDDSKSVDSEDEAIEYAKPEEADPTAATQSIDTKTDAGDDGDGDGSEENDSDKSDKSDADGSEENDSKDSSNDDGTKDKDDTSAKERPTATTTSQFSKESKGTVPEITTNAHFEQMSKTMVEDEKHTKETIYACLPSNKSIESMVISSKTIFAGRDARLALASQNGTSGGPAEIGGAFDHKFKDFMGTTKKFVSVLSKEFEMRKAAYQYSRATVSQTGVLNVNKLHAYKISDDIFNSVTQLANAKSHGMMMFVDYSYSMNMVLPFVLKHIINLSLFCKSTGIPFQVYGFTGDNDSRAYVDPYDQTLGRKDSEIIVDNAVILDLINSKMSKADFNRSIRDLYAQSTSMYYASKYERLGNTPLNETIIAAHKLVKEFKLTHNVQKMTTVFLTDGVGQNMRHFVNEEYNGKRCGRGYETRYNFVLNGRRVCTHSIRGGNDITSELMENLKITTGTKTIGFFIPSNNTNAQRNVVRALQSVKTPGVIDHSTQYTSAYSMWQTKMSKQYRKNKSVNIEKCFGYDQYFVVASGTDLDTETEDLDINEGMTRSKMAKAFSEFSKSKQINRVFVSKFAETIS
jgi:hypothetical protein